MRKVNRITLGLLLLCVASLQTAWGDDIYGKIDGTVTDASGSAIPGAAIKATNTQTGVAQSVQSHNDGNFEFLQLPVGIYDVVVTKTGFSTLTERHLVLEVGQTSTLKAKLEVGAVTESVQVVANMVQLQTTTTQLDTIIDAKQIVDLPLNGRNWTQLQQLAPGVMSSNDRFGTYSTNGAQTQQNAFLINGSNTNDLPLNTPLIIPSPDALGEFNLVTSSINPEYGRNSGAVLNAILKSGTNQFHGVGFEFYRDTFLDDRNFFQLTKPVYQQNQYGGVFSGPIVKNHLFFMVSYQGTPSTAPQTGGSTTVFSAAQRGGNFSDLATSTGTSPYALVGSSGITYPAGTAYSTIFPTGQIPAADINPISAKLLSFVPLSNAPANTYVFNPSDVSSAKQFIFRTDYTLNDRDSFWVTGLFQHAPSNQTLAFTAASVPGFPEVDKRSSTVMQGAWNHTFNSSTINEFRLSWVRFNFAAVEPVTPVAPSSLGFSINPQNTSGEGLPSIGVTGLFTLGFSTNGPQPRIDSNYEVVDNFSKVIGKHTFKFGFDGTRYDVQNPFFFDNNGAYSFGGNGTYSTGDPGADFLLGIPDTYGQSSGGNIVARTYETYLYAQDSWKAAANLTVNYGIGYTIDTPLVNNYYHGEAVNCFIPGEQSTYYPTAPVGLDFPGDKGCSHSGYSAHYDHFGPRFGFAYSPDFGWLSGGTSKKLVIRSGFGIYFNRSEEELALQNLTAPPFSVFSGGIGDQGGSPSFANPFVDISTGASEPNKYPFVPAAAGSKVDFSFFEPLSINTISPQFTSPYAMNYNLNIQRELPGSMILQVAYVGSQGRHLEMAYEANPISLSAAAACAKIPSCISNRTIQTLIYPNATPLAPGDIFPSVGVQATNGVSNYNSLQLSLKKNFTHGLFFQAAYTWAHSIDDASGFENSGFGTRGTNPYNFALDRGDSAFDARQRFVVNYNYELPHLSRYWNNTFTRYVLDGYTLAGITTLQGGFPIDISDSGFTSLTCSAYSFYGCPDAPNTVSAVSTFDPRNTTFKGRPNYYFNPADFAVAPFGVIGNTGRDSIHGPGMINTDLTISKLIRYKGESNRYIQLRLEAYNAFNHTNFSNPGSNIESASTFGRITAAAAGRTVQLGAKIYF